MFSYTGFSAMRVVAGEGPAGSPAGGGFFLILLTQRGMFSYTGFSAMRVVAGEGPAGSPAGGGF
ncbi:hypothetical protein CQA48_30635, partial [Klebsiella pneumoniae]